MISLDYIKSLNPCGDRLENYLKHYSDFSGSLNDFLDLTEITFKDKIWVSVRYLTKENCQELSITCAELVLPIFEKKYPSDSRPRNAIEIAKKRLCNNYNVSADAAADAAYAAASDAAASASAASAAHAAHAAYAANAAADAAYAAQAAARAAYAVAVAAACETKQQILNKIKELSK